jgi:hypothetical protein
MGVIVISPVHSHPLTLDYNIRFSVQKLINVLSVKINSLISYIGLLPAMQAFRYYYQTARPSVFSLSQHKLRYPFVIPSEIEVNLTCRTLEGTR